MKLDFELQSCSRRCRAEVHNEAYSMASCMAIVLIKSVFNTYPLPNSKYKGALDPAIHGADNVNNVRSNALMNPVNFVNSRGAVDEIQYHFQ